MVENLAASVEAFSSPTSLLIEERAYKNRKNVSGRYFVVRFGNQFHKVSISNCQFRPTQSQIAECLRQAQQIEPSNKEGFYENVKQVPGYYASFQNYAFFDEKPHWFMLSRSNDLKTLLRMQNAGM